MFERDISNVYIPNLIFRYTCYRDAQFFSRTGASNIRLRPPVTLERKQKRLMKGGTWKRSYKHESTKTESYATLPARENWKRISATVIFSCMRAVYNKESENWTFSSDHRSLRHIKSIAYTCDFTKRNCIPRNLIPTKVLLLFSIPTTFDADYRSSDEGKKHFPSVCFHGTTCVRYIYFVKMLLFWFRAFHFILSRAQYKRYY